VRLPRAGPDLSGRITWLNWCPASGSAVSDLEVEMKGARRTTSGTSATRSSNGAAVIRPRSLVVAHHPALKTLLGDHRRGRAPPLTRAMRLSRQDDHPAAGVAARSDRGREPRWIQPSARDCVQGHPRPRRPTTSPRRPPRAAAITVMAQDGTHERRRGPLRRWIRFESAPAVVAAMRSRRLPGEGGGPRHSVPFSDSRQGAGGAVLSTNGSPS